MTLALGDALYVDAASVLICGFFLARSKQFRHTHPGVIYLIFHILVFTYRGWTIEGGAPPVLGLSVASAAEALLMADLFLACATVGWCIAPGKGWNLAVANPEHIRPTMVYAVALAAMPIGLYFLLTHTYGKGSGTASIEFSTSYQIVAVTWPGLMLLALIYIKGFKWQLLLPLAAYLVYMALQGQGRFRVVLPAILLCQMWLDHRGKRVPTLRVIAAMAALFIVFVGMDSFGTAFRTNELSLSNASAIISESSQVALKGQANDQHGLDSLGVAVEQSDRLGRPLYGQNYLDLVFLPIPRPLWPDKPPTNQTIVDLSTPDRPLKSMGAVLTLPGSLYVDFRWFGIVVGAFVLARFSLWAFCRAYARGFGSTGHFLYLLLAASLVQIYRDSLASLPLFLLVKNAPLVLIVVLNHVIKPPREVPQLRPAGSRGDGAR
ncbi:O-antigen polymerase [Nocardioides sp. HB32]